MAATWAFFLDGLEWCVGTDGPVLVAMAENDWGRGQVQNTPIWERYCALRSGPTPTSSLRTATWIRERVLRSDNSRFVYAR